MTVTVKFKPSEPIEIEIDPDKLTWEDFLLLNNAKNLSEDEALKQFNAIMFKLTGQDIGKMPARHVSAIVAQLKTIADGNDVKN